MSKNTNEADAQAKIEQKSLWVHLSPNAVMIQSVLTRDERQSARRMKKNGRNHLFIVYKLNSSQRRNSIEFNSCFKLFESCRYIWKVECNPSVYLCGLFDEECAVAGLRTANCPLIYLIPAIIIDGVLITSFVSVSSQWECFDCQKLFKQFYESFSCEYIPKQNTKTNAFCHHQSFHYTHSIILSQYCPSPNFCLLCFQFIRFVTVNASTSKLNLISSSRISFIQKWISQNNIIRWLKYSATIRIIVISAKYLSFCPTIANQNAVANVAAAWWVFKSFEFCPDWH